MHFAKIRIELMRSVIIFSPKSTKKSRTYHYYYYLISDSDQLFS